jgi:hypothetical protein
MVESRGWRGCVAMAMLQGVDHMEEVGDRGGCRGKLIEEVGEDRDGLTIWRGTRRRRQRAHIKYVHPHPHAVGSLCVTEPSQK